MAIEKDHGYKNQPFKKTMVMEKRPWLWSKDHGYRKKTIDLGSVSITMVFFRSYGLLDALGGVRGDETLFDVVLIVSNHNEWFISYTAMHPARTPEMVQSVAQMCSILRRFEYCAWLRGGKGELWCHLRAARSMTSGCNRRTRPSPPTASHGTPESSSSRA